MCLGIPGRIVEIWDEPSGARMAHVEYPVEAPVSGAPAVTELRRLCLAYLPDLQVGDYTIAHAGFALTRIEEESARMTIATMAGYGVFGDDGVGHDPVAS
ncbi:HypC/HybG/HupF family hydrogenase formation chaperone [Pseudonocardia alni]|uniref:HypC/HybG/HupF family hydrogenase formation chaperone n=1 Tax=Pseudonocardia alni TaxID=33907 RepID=UPI0036890256